MITQKHIISISPTLFVNSLPTEMHSEAKAMFENQAVTHIALFVANEGDDRYIVAVGENSEYKTIETLIPSPIAGMHAMAIVDAQQPFPNLSKIRSPRQHSPFTKNTQARPQNSVKQPAPAGKKPSQSPQWPTRSSTQSKLTKKPAPPSNNSNNNSLNQHQNDLLQDQVKELKRTLAEVRGKMMLQEQTISELNTHIEQLKQNSFPGESDNNVESVLSDRESSVTKAEEELINRLTYLMEKEAELEQYEENLAGIAQRLEEREKKLEANETKNDASQL
jgi:hypothetical protein